MIDIWEKDLKIGPHPLSSFFASWRETVATEVSGLFAKEDVLNLLLAIEKSAPDVLPSSKVRAVLQDLQTTTRLCSLSQEGWATVLKAAARRLGLTEQDQTATQ